MRGTRSSHLPGYWGAVAATRLVGADPRILGGVGGALGAASYLGTGGGFAATRLVGADPRVLGGEGGALGATSYLGTGGLLLLPVL